MNREHIRAFVQTLSRSVSLNDSTQLFREKVLDSMNILALIGFVEKELGRKLYDDEIALKNFESIDAMDTAFHA